MEVNIMRDFEKAFLVYEFAGWINTPDECAGDWFADFPHPTTVGKKRPEPRVSYYDHARGSRQSRNWQVYNVLVSLNYINQVIWIEDIFRIEWEVAKLPQVKLHPPGGITKYSDAEYYIPKSTRVNSFYDKDGHLYVVEDNSKETREKLTAIVRHLYEYDEERRCFNKELI
jgi:hypothetical protein